MCLFCFWNTHFWCFGQHYTWELTDKNQCTWLRFNSKLSEMIMKNGMSQSSWECTIVPISTDLMYRICAVPHKVVCSFVLWIELWSAWLFCVEYLWITAIPHRTISQITILFMKQKNGPLCVEQHWKSQLKNRGLRNSFDCILGSMAICHVDAKLAL